MLDTGIRYLPSSIQNPAFNYHDSHLRHHLVQHAASHEVRHFWRRGLRRLAFTRSYIEEKAASRSAARRFSRSEPPPQRGGARRDQEIGRVRPVLGKGFAEDGE